jgi:hypothetical protein
MGRRTCGRRQPGAVGPVLMAKQIGLAALRNERPPAADRRLAAGTVAYGSVPGRPGWGWGWGGGGCWSHLESVQNSGSYPCFPGGRGRVRLARLRPPATHLRDRAGSNS